MPWRWRRHVDDVVALDFNLVFAALLLADWEVMSHEVRGIWWRRWVHHFFRRRWGWWRGFRHRPHVHCNGPVWLDHCLPDLGKDDFAVWADEVIVAFMDMRADHVDVEEGLLDELFHTLEYVII